MSASNRMSAAAFALPRLGLAALAVAALAACDGRHGPSPAELTQGEAIYKAECAACHGAKGEGQPDWRTRRADGKLPAPPHDASGHTWHHPMEQLFAIVKFGMVPPNAPEGYLSDMPAYGAKLNDSQIRAVLAYIESTWPPEVHAQRAARFARPK
jgi:mono/diheme cytochrome c family protein